MTPGVNDDLLAVVLKLSPNLLLILSTVWWILSILLDYLGDNGDQRSSSRHPSWYVLYKLGVVQLQWRCS